MLLWSQMWNHIWSHIWQNIYRVNRAYHCAMLELFTGDPWSSSRVQISLLQLARLPWLFINLLIRLLWQENYVRTRILCRYGKLFMTHIYIKLFASVWLDKQWRYPQSSKKEGLQPLCISFCNVSLKEDEPNRVGCNAMGSYSCAYVHVLNLATFEDIYTSNNVTKFGCTQVTTSRWDREIHRQLSKIYTI